MRKNSRKLSTQDSVLSSNSTDSDMSPTKPGALKRSSTMISSELSNARIIQSKLVYIINLPESVASEDLLKSEDMFGQYGTITKCVLNKSAQHVAYQVYLTYKNDEEAAVCIKACNKFKLEGNEINATFGTTKYCNYFLKGNSCPKPDCLYLHEFATQNNIVFREIMPQTRHIQPCDSIFDGLKVIISEPVGNRKLPSARVIRERAQSGQIFESPQVFKSRFGFTLDGDEIEIPQHVKVLRKYSSPNEVCSEIPLSMFHGVIREQLEDDKWHSDVLGIELVQEKALIYSKY